MSAVAVAALHCRPKEELPPPGQRPSNNKRHRYLALMGIVVMAILAATDTAIAASTANPEASAKPPRRNVIMMVSDGFGPASATYGRTYQQYVNKLPVNYMSPLDDILVGASRTRSSSNLVTDSAAGATAFSCALKTYNEAVAVDPARRPCGTVLEAAKAKGLKTALVVTSSMTDATPAAFSSHVPWRSMESSIAQQQIGDGPLNRTVDLMFGGGYCHFQPNTTKGSCRKDDRDLLAEARERGWSAVSSREEFDRLSAATSLPVHALFAPGNMAYEIDRDARKEPALHEMAQKALDIMAHATRDQEQGFFIMIEGSKIDMAAHGNDPVAHVHDILAYFKTIEVVKAFVDAHPGTVMVSTSDHETGGLTLGRKLGPEKPEYNWHPEVIAAIRKSTWELATAIVNAPGEHRRQYIKETVLGKWAGIHDASDADLDFLSDTARSYEDRRVYLTEMINRRAMLGWTSRDHTGVDVNLYAYGKAAVERMRGSHENTDIGRFIADYLGLDLKSITDKLRSAKPFMPTM